MGAAGRVCKGGTMLAGERIEWGQRIEDSDAELVFLRCRSHGGIMSGPDKGVGRDKEWTDELDSPRLVRRVTAPSRRFENITSRLRIEGDCIRIQRTRSGNRRLPRRDKGRNDKTLKGTRIERQMG
jgi:hypothetical protein